ncbi:MBL fold metallo-hydrolase [Fodinicola feengrottensis]|uniref:MBL fold metallo-hydrolase n=1 Tax=Fodinicola feengrottensis TaxID=435914 RepID=A0ABP4TWZ7_9ACTN
MSRVPDPEMQKIGDGVYAYVQPDGGWMLNNTGVVVAEDGGHVLVDTTSTEARNRALLAAVDRLHSGPPQALVNTHHHGDHTFGNWLMPAETPIMGHLLCREDLVHSGLIAAQVLTGPDYGHIELRPPTVTFADTLTLHLADRQLDLRHVGPAHTRGDVVVWLPDSRVLFAGDVVFNGGQPLLLEGSLAGYSPALAAIRALEPEVLVPGHGPVCRGDDIPRVLDDLTAYASFVDALARDGHAAGRPPLEVAKATDLAIFADWQEGERLVANIHRAYSELAGEPLGSRLDLVTVWPDMMALRGGPIRSRA